MPFGYILGAKSGLLRATKTGIGVRSMTSNYKAGCSNSKTETISINQLHPFKNHPFAVRHDLELSELTDSISESGIINPLIVRPNPINAKNSSSINPMCRGISHRTIHRSRCRMSSLACCEVGSISEPAVKDHSVRTNWNADKQVQYVMDYKA